MEVKPIIVTTPQIYHRRAPGTYILIMHLGRPTEVVVGALEAFDLEPGYYLYVGSALNGLSGRLRRHCRSDSKRLHWHVDYLRTQAALVEVWWTVSAEHLECDWAAVLRGLPGTSEPVAGFGASDCRCYSHLFHMPEEPPLREFTDRRPEHCIRRSSEEPFLGTPE